MSYKDKILLALCPPIIGWSLYEGVNVFKATQVLANDYPQCYQTNPYRTELFFGTLIVLACTMIPIQMAGY